MLKGLLSQTCHMPAASARTLAALTIVHAASQAMFGSFNRMSVSWSIINVTVQA
jgi:hypothetical protein